MKEQIHNLIELQRLDAEIAHENAEKRDLPNRIAKLDEGFTAASGKVEDQKKKLEETSHKHRQREDSLKRGVENLKRTKERLLDVKTNREYQAMLKEIEQMTNRNSETEDEIIYVLEEIDTVKLELKKREEELAHYKSKYLKERGVLQEALGKIDGVLRELTKNLDQVRGKIPAHLLKRFEIIKSRTNGRAIVAVHRGVCGGCHMNIPPQMYIELQRGDDDIMSCPFCSRIIYYEPAENGKDSAGDQGR